MSLLLLVRHGQASFLSDDYDRLSELGIRQSRLLGEHWIASGLGLDAAYSGPLERQKGTARAVLDAYRERGVPAPSLEIVQGWNEYPGIAMVKRSLPVLLERRPDVTALLDTTGIDDPALQRRRFQQAFEVVMKDWLHGRLGIEGIESWSEFTDRVREGLESVLARHPRGATVAVFSSGGAIAAALQQVMGLSDEVTLELSWVIKNGSYSEIRFSSHRRTLVGFNHTPHLPTADLVTYR